MPSVRFSDLRPLLAVGGLVAACAVPIACAHGSTETDLGGFGGFGGGFATTGTTTTNTVTSSGFPTSSSSTTGGFPSASSSTSTTTTTTGGFPSASSSSSTTTGGFPTASASSSSSSTSTSTTSGSPTTSSSSTSTSTSSTSTSAGGSTCDNKASCDACVQCADQTVCLAAGDACYNDLYCWDVYSCAVGCTTSSCIDFCILVYGDAIAEQLFVDYYNCLGCSCENDCQVTGCP